MLAALGYCVVTIDSRGSQNRGVKFESHIKGRLVLLLESKFYPCYSTFDPGYGGAARPSRSATMAGRIDGLHRYEPRCDTRVVVRWLPKFARLSSIPSYLQIGHRWRSRDLVDFVRHGVHREIHGPTANESHWVQNRLCTQLHQPIS